MKFVPFALSMMLHYNGTPRRWENNSGVTQEWRDYFLREAMLMPREVHYDAHSDDPYEITEKGRAFVAMLCNTPLPVSGWRDPRNNEIIEQF